MSNSILVVDDSPVDLEFISLACESLDCEVDVASTVEEALQKYRDKQHTLILTDYQMAPHNGIDLALRLREINPNAECVFMTGRSDSTLANFVIEHDLPMIVNKPIRPANLRDRLRVALHRRRGATSAPSSVALTNRMDECVALLGESPHISNVRKRIRELVKSHLPFLIEGSPGIGKPQIAELIHQNGPFGQSNYKLCDCAVLKEHGLECQLIAQDGTWGKLLDDARDGTVALSNVDALPTANQAQLAKAFPEIIKEIHVICLLDKPLDEIMDDGELDDMLYFQLSLESLHIPDLSERPVDVEEMVRFVTSKTDRFGLDREPQPIEVDALVANLRKAYLERNVDELVERVRAYCVEQKTA